MEPAPSSGRRAVEGIRDNSFLIEEAYNQEPGVVQHIMTGLATWDNVGNGTERNVVLALTQEWPLFTQRHQVSYTVPYVFQDAGGVSEDGVGDVFLNYRFQAWWDEGRLEALAPRLSLVLPTGSAARGLGDDTVGVQMNLPYSRALGDAWFVHANAGVTLLPDSGIDGAQDRWFYNLGTSVIYAPSARFHVLLEWVGVWVEDGDTLGSNDYRFETVVSPGVRYAMNFGGDAQLVAGIAAPLGLSGSAPDYGVFLYLSFEHRFRRDAGR
jgi:hypothetical protein